MAMVTYLMLVIGINVHTIRDSTSSTAVGVAPPVRSSTALSV
jgi:hypothetical protein